jgi:prepilin-type N-terminal cleavage/methylation domain-containing protein
MNSGFTLIETLVVLAILGVLTTMFLGYNDVHTGQLSLYVDRAKVIGALERAKGLALQKYVDGEEEVCAFGVGWSNQEYFIYKVTSTTLACGASYDYKENDANYSKEQKFELNGKNVFVGSGNAYFVPPYFRTSTDVTLTIKNIDTNKYVKVYVSGSNIWGGD